MQKTFPYLIGQVAVLGIVTFACSTKLSENQQEKKFNVLFIAIDDLRPHLGCYGFDYVKTPNIDKIASNGMVFTRAYNQYPLCGPSRTSLFTGVNPDVTGVYINQTRFLDSIPDIITLPHLFRQNGYFTQGFGKLFHSGTNDPQAWSVPHVSGRRPRTSPHSREIVEKRQAEIKKRLGDSTDRDIRARGPAFESYECDDFYFLDGGNTEDALIALEKIKDTTFFLALGFSNVHLPFVSPKKYWDLYDTVKIDLPSNQFPPEGSPAWAVTGIGELNSYYGVPNPLTDEYKRELTKGYIAATSYLDALIGKMVDALRTYNLLDKTVIIIWSDHGYQLGEHGTWATKHTNYETSTRTPLIISVPGMKAAGQKSSSFVEFIDIYPSLADICGLEIPPHCQGKSFKPLIDDASAVIRNEAYSQCFKPLIGPTPFRELTLQERIYYRGYTVRDDRYRLVQWIIGDSIKYELYDHEIDPEENNSIAGDPGVQGIIQSMSNKINSRIQSDLKLKSLLTNK